MSPPISHPNHTDPLLVPLPLPPSHILHDLTHRIALAPMTRMRAHPITAIPSPSALPYYRERTTPGSLLISEGIVIHPRGKGFPSTPGIWNTAQVEAWKPITHAVREAGGVFFAQLWHVGRVSVPSQLNGLLPLSATSTALPGHHLLFGATNSTEPYIPGQAMTPADIRATLQQFAEAARHAIAAGFAGVEIHAGNGYLLDTFVHSNINDRADEYGGTLENRLRFPLQVVDAVVAAVGPARTAVRIAPFHVLQRTMDAHRMTTFRRYVQELEGRRLAYVHIVEARYDQLSTEGAFSADVKRGEGPGGERVAEAIDRNGEKDLPEEFSLWTFRRLLKTTVLVGAGGYTPESAREAVEEGRVDVVAVGRHFTSNPDLVRRFLEGLPLTPYDRRTFYTGTDEGYLGWEVASR